MQMSSNISMTNRQGSNRLSLYCAMQGKCAITGKILEIGEIHCHHKTPIKSGGTDKYENLLLISENVHILLHATTGEYIKSLFEDKTGENYNKEGN